ncbi:MAG: FAD:protein FMN transferase [Clostridiales bacterium]|nr:FAD:protein FMN transferase [Clostridiales bacterium]MDU1042171.1 FAD:protein FMN transferase [Clostridiales bacterium]
MSLSTKRKIKKTLVLSAAVGLISVLGVNLSGCANRNGSAILKEPIKANDFKLDTYVSVNIYDDVDPSIAKDTLAQCDKYEDIFSMQKEGSVLWKVNHDQITTIPADLGKAIDAALEISNKTDGNFQISIGRVSSLWDFSSDKKIIPPESALKEALATVDDSKISVRPLDPGDPNGDWTINKPKQTIIDLGAVAKGYIADRLKEYLASRLVRHALINLGGNVLCMGGKGNDPFKIGIQKPFASSGTTSAILSLKDKSSVSSGISERYFKGDDGKLYHHILNPKTGYPYDNNLYQVTIISDSSLDGDCLSTTCYVLGLEKGMKFIESLKDFEAVFITSDQELHYSSGAKQYAIH